MKRKKSLLLIVIGLILIGIAAFFLMKEESSENINQEPTGQEQQKKVEFDSMIGEKIDVSSYQKATLKQTGQDYLNGHNLKEKNKIEYLLFIDNKNLFDSFYEKFYDSPTGEMTIFSRISSYPSLDTAIKYFEEENFNKELYPKYNYSVSKNKDHIDGKQFKYILSNVIDKNGDFYQLLDIIIELDDYDYFQITYTIKNKVFDEKDIIIIISNIKVKKGAANYLLFEGNNSKGYLRFVNDDELKKLYLEPDKDKYKEIEDSRNDLDKTSFEHVKNNEKIYISIEYENSEDILPRLILEYNFDECIKKEKDYKNKKITILTENKENIFYTEIDNNIFYLVKTKLSFEDISDFFDYNLE